MKQFIEVIFVLCVSVLAGTILLGMLTLGAAFSFESYNIYGYILVYIWYIACICGGLLWYTYEKE